MPATPSISILQSQVRHYKKMAKQAQKVDEWIPQARLLRERNLDRKWLQRRRNGEKRKRKGVVVFIPPVLTRDEWRMAGNKIEYKKSAIEQLFK